MISKIALFLIFTVISFSAYAAAVSIEATVSSNKISLNEPVQLTLTIAGAKDIDRSALLIPKIDGLDIQPVGGESTRISIINGAYSSEKSFAYSLIPTKTGRVQIPVITFKIDGNDYTTKPIELEVVEAAAGNAQASENVKDRIFMVVSTPKGHVYLGQKIPLSIKLFVNQLPVRNVQFPQFEKNGFTVDSPAQPQQYSQVLNGTKYDVVDFRFNLYPSKSGELTIGPVTIQVSLVYKAQDKQSSGIFDDDLFNRFFNAYQERPATVTAEAMKVNVMDVPSDGKPENFSGAVGELKFEAGVSPLQVKVGDPLTLRMKISGNANLKLVQFPQINDPLFKTYEPQIKDEADARLLEQVIVPTSEKIMEVPALSFNYFDAAAGSYKTVIQGPFLVNVLAPLKDQEFKAIGFTNLPQSSIHVAQIDYIQKYIVEPIKAVVAFLNTPLCWLILLGISIIAALIFLWSRYRQRLMNDSAFARKVNAYKKAKAGIVQAQGYFNAGQVQEFYGILSKTLNNYLADKSIVQDKIPVETKAMINNILEISDLARFSGSKLEGAQMGNDLAKLESIVAVLEKLSKQYQENASLICLPIA